jgi:thiol-disulfide isomerase/thioredoxin
MAERLLIALALVVGAVVLTRLGSRFLLEWRARRGLMIPGYRLGRAALLYFTAPGCGPCETVQKPALRALSAAYGNGLQIFQIDATVQPGLADAWGVLSVPTTFLIDAQGRPRRVNHGPVRAGALIRQLVAVGALPRQPLPSTESAPLEG